MAGKLSNMTLSQIAIFAI